MRYIDVCSGISAPTMAWKPLGWEALCFAEIEAAPRSVLTHHYPTVPLRGDFTEIRGDEYGPVDLLVGGTPCQDFSVAGLRAGLDGERGNLTLEFLRLLGRTRARWVVWENVPGALSSVSHIAPDFSPPDIDLDAGDGPEDGEEVVVEDGYDADESHAFACFLAGLSELGYGWAYRIFDAQHAGVPQRRRREFVVGYLGDWRRPAAVLFERHSLQGHSPPRRETGPIVAALTADGVGTCGADDNQGQAGHLIAHSLRAEGFDASEDGTGRGTPLVPVAYQTSGNCGAWETGDKIGALDTGTDPSSHVVCFSAKDHGADASDIAPTLRAGGHSSSHANAGVMPAIAFDTTQISSAANYSNPKPGDPCHPLAAGAHPPAIAGSAVRRLTPRECERLQGFPDDFTLVPHRGKPMADGPRYKMLGNSMAVPVVRWVGERIQAVEAMTQSQRLAA